jgi:hypothetical protein
MKRSPGPRKSPFNLSESVHQHVNMYALAASAAGVGVLAMAQPAAAEIVYTPALRKLTHGHQLSIDLNHDGTTDFVIAIKSQYWSSMCTFCGQYMSVLGNGNAGAGVIGTLVEAAGLKKGAVIGPDDSFQNIQNAGRLMASGFNDNNSFFYVNGQFANKKNRFLGVKFEIKGKTHYGWVRLGRVTVGFEHGVAPIITAVLNGYAYETIPNKPITAGKTEGPEEASVDEANPATLKESTLQPASLGLLAMGSPALSIWRREKSPAEIN